MLYELLTGTTPFDTATLTRGGLEEMRRIIREVEPLRPSRKISTLHAELLTTVSDRRQADVRKLSLTMRRELDWIVMRAMEKDRNRRYESASAFAADVQRYLDDEPVAACPPSSAYRLRKFARRNKTTLLTAITVSTALLIGTAVSIWQAFEATNARKLADERLVLADERLENEKQARADAVKQRKQASANLQQALDAVDQMLLRVADDRLAAIPGTEPVRQELFQDALKFYEGFFQQAPDDPQLRISTAKAWARVGNLHDFLGNPTKAQEARQEAIERWETLHAERSDDPQIQAALAEAYRDFADCEHWTRHRFASAKPALERAISLWQDLQRRFPDTLDFQWNATRAEAVLADNYRNTSRIDLAERTYRHAVDAQRRLWDREAISSKSHWSLGSSLMLLGLLLTENKKRDDEAEPLFVEAVRRGEEVLASNPQSVSAAKPLVCSMYEYGRFLESRNRVVEAEKHYRRAVEVGQLLPRVNPRAINDIFFLPRAQVALADLLARDGRHSEAFGIYRAAGDLLRPGAVLPERNGYLNSVYSSADRGMLSSLAQLARGGHLDEAQKLCEELTQGGGSGSVAILSQDLAMRAWERIGELDRASQLREKLAKELEQRNPDGLDQRDRESIAHVIFALGDNDFHRRNYDRALPLFDRAIRINPGESEAFDHRGQIYLARGENEKALADLDESIRLGAPYGFLTFNCRALAYFRLAHYSRSLADLTEAVKLRSGDARTLNAIDPSEIAACSDAGFRKTYIAWFEQAFAESKSSSEARVSHAALLGELRQFDSLPDDLAAILADASASPHVLYQAALLALQAGDQSHYREFCRLLSSRDSIPLDATKCHFIAWTAAVASDALDDYERAITAARYALTLEPTDRTALLDLGGILYRARKLDGALEYLTKSDSTPTMTKTPPEYAHFFLAMTHHKLGHNAEARQWFGQSIAETERMLADGKTASGEPLSWNRRLTLELLRAEATALFREAPAKSPPKTDAPESAPPK